MPRRVTGLFLVFWGWLARSPCVLGCAVHRADAAECRRPLYARGEIETRMWRPEGPTFLPLLLDAFFGPFPRHAMPCQIQPRTTGCAIRDRTISSSRFIDQSSLLWPFHLHGKGSLRKCGFFFSRCPPARMSRAQWPQRDNGGRRIRGGHAQCNPNLALFLGRTVSWFKRLGEIEKGPRRNAHQAPRELTRGNHQRPFIACPTVAAAHVLSTWRLRMDA